MTVRDDVRQYIWNLLDQIVPGKYCRVCYLGNLMSSRGSSMSEAEKIRCTVNLIFIVATFRNVC